MLPHRTKLYAIGMAALVAAAAALFLATPAAAAEWHAYEGDVFPGHAYGLQVPADAESFEILWTGPSNASASLAVYDPAGAKVGHYALSESLTSAAVVAPVQGRYVIYVYELTGGALDLRVSAPVAPAALDLQKMPLVREDVAVSTSDAPARLDKAITATLKAPAVFLTLLYEGSAQGMDATVSSAKGPVMTITGESGTAFSPGVYSSLSGERRMDAANLDGTLYTVEVHAASFEGTLFLTTLAVDFKTSSPTPPVAKAPAAPDAPPAQAPAPAPWNATGGATFAFGAGKAYAFLAQPGELLLADPLVNEKEGKRNASRYDVHGAVSIYAPNDTLLAHVVLDHDRMNATVALPVEGEYVAYVHHARKDVILAKLAGAPADPSLRELPLAEEALVFEPASFLGGDVVEFTLARVPVALTLEARGLDALRSAHVENEAGVVASYNAVVGGTGFQGLEWTWVDPTLFRAGEHTFAAHGFLGQDMVLTSVSYLRSGAVPDAEAHDHGTHEGHEPHGEDRASEGRKPLLPLTLGTPPIPGLYG